MSEDGGRIKRPNLANYYGSSEDEQLGLLDINSKSFDHKFYVQKIIKEKSLKQLLEEESILVNEVQRLDSDCQTLVYDHYDKFIAATDIVKQMKEGSTQMSTQVSNLQENMKKITESSQSITADLQGPRENLSQLLGIHSTLKKLQFLFHLPQKIDECIKNEKFAEGVQCYVETAEVLQKYQHLPSFSAIHTDCQAALLRLNNALKSQLAMKEGSASHLTMCVDLLLKLGEPAESLCDEFLTLAKGKLQEDLDHLASIAQADHSDQEETESKYMEIQPFMECCHDTFVANLWMVISSYKDLFIRTNDRETSGNMALEKLGLFVISLVDEYVCVVGVRVASENKEDEQFLDLTTALDKFHRRLHAIAQLLPHTDFTDSSLSLIMDVAEQRCLASLDRLKKCFEDDLKEVGKTLASPQQLTQENSTSAQLNELLTRLVSSTASNIKDRMSALKAFNHPKMTFAMRNEFRDRFNREFVREGVVVAFFLFVVDHLRNFNPSKDPSLVLLLSRMCLDLYTSTLHYLLNLCDEQLLLSEKQNLTPLSSITSAMKETGQELLNQYVICQGTSISQMLRKSVELKDWLGCSEPRTVRRVMKTVRDELVSMDSQVGALYEEGLRKDRSSDSSRRTFHSVSASRLGGTGRSSGWSGFPPSGLDNSLVANLSKLWSEKIEIFAPVQFTRMSIMTGIIKISLKTLLECIRLQTFSTFGFQQVQVDAHYLRMYLWSYVADEQILNVLLDEVLSSASLRCKQPELMEIKVAEFICEQS